jgi:hypothetical protein
VEIRLYDFDTSFTGNDEEMVLVKKIDELKMYKNIEFGGFIVIDGKSYRHCMYNSKKDILAVEPVNLNEEPEEIEYSSDFECPFCGSIDQDAWELDDEGETHCGSCGSELEYEKVVTVEYNIRPKKCAQITKV